MRPKRAVMTDQESANQIIHAIPSAAAIPTFESLSLEDAIRLFRSWGFQVEPGPRPEEITLVLNEPDYRTTSVCNASMLPAIAAVALRVRWQNGMLSRQAHISAQPLC